MTENAAAVPMDLHFAIPVITGEIPAEQLGELLHLLNAGSWQPAALETTNGGKREHEWLGFFLPSLRSYFAGEDEMRQAWVFERRFDSKSPSPGTYSHGLPFDLLAGGKPIPFWLERVTLVVLASGIVFLAPLARLAVSSGPAESSGTARHTLAELAAFVAALVQVNPRRRRYLCEGHTEQSRSFPFPAGPSLLDESSEARSGTRETFRLGSLASWCLDERGDGSARLVTWIPQRTIPVLSFVRFMDTPPDKVPEVDFWRLYNGFGLDHRPSARDASIGTSSVMELGEDFYVGATLSGVGVMHLAKDAIKGDHSRESRVRTAYLLHFLLSLHQRVMLRRLLARAAALPPVKDLRMASARHIRDVQLLRDDVLEFDLRHRFAVVSEGVYYERMYARLMSVLSIPQLTEELQDEVQQLARLASDGAAALEEVERERRAMRLNYIIAALGGPALSLSLLGSNHAWYVNGPSRPAAWVLVLALALLPLLIPLASGLWSSAKPPSDGLDRDRTSGSNAGVARTRPR